MASASSIVVIEQPELHLHPAYQANIADVFVAAIKNARAANRSITVLAETHSPHLVNRMGQLIEQGVFGREDVQVILFDESEDGDRSVVKVSYFDNKGVLLDWPFGFFEPDY